MRRSPTAAPVGRRDEGYVTARELGDNACVESFFGTLKRELIHHRQYWTRTEAMQGIFESIEVIYNRQRCHSTLGYRPSEFEANCRITRCPRNWGKDQGSLVMQSQRHRLESDSCRRIGDIPERKDHIRHAEVHAAHRALHIGHKPRRISD